MIPKRDGPIWDITKTYHQDLGFVKVKSLLAWTIYFHISRLWFFNRILLSGETSYNHTLSGWSFSIWTPSKTYTWRSSTYILSYSNLRHSSQNTVYHRPCWHVIMTSQLVREWDGHICDVFATTHWYVDKTSQFETSQQRTNWYLSETDGSAFKYHQKVLHLGCCSSPGSASAIGTTFW